MLMLCLLLFLLLGVFNIEGGCYAKCIGLKAASEPEIYKAIRFGSVLENVVINESTRDVDYMSNVITENTRASYPIDYIDNAKIPCVGPQPRNVVLLCCDAFGWVPGLHSMKVYRCRQNSWVCFECQAPWLSVRL